MKTDMVEEFHGADAAVGKSFHDLPIHSVVQSNIDRLGFVRMTPIQERTLPISLAGRDVAGGGPAGGGGAGAGIVAKQPRDATPHRSRK